MKSSDRLSKVRHARPRTPIGTGEQIAEVMPNMAFTIEDQRLALRLGITLREHEQPCHGYGCCCTCPACKNLERQINAHRSAGREPFDAEGKVKAPPRKRQPWQAQRAA